MIALLIVSLLVACLSVVALTVHGSRTPHPNLDAAARAVILLVVILTLACVGVGVSVGHLLDVRRGWIA